MSGKYSYNIWWPVSDAVEIFRTVILKFWRLPAKIAFLLQCEIKKLHQRLFENPYEIVIGCDRIDNLWVGWCSDHSEHRLSRWETTLRCNDVSNWLSPEWALWCVVCIVAQILETSQLTRRCRHGCRKWHRSWLHYFYCWWVFLLRWDIDVTKKALLMWIHKSMAMCETAVSAVLKHSRYRSLVPNHWSYMCLNSIQN